MAIAYPAAAQPYEPHEQRHDEIKREAKAEAFKPVDTLFWANGGIGYGALYLNTFRAEEVDGTDRLTAGIVPTRASGPAADLGVGLRLFVVTLGARAGVMSVQGEAPNGGVDSLQLWSLDAELGFRIPLGRIEPHFFVAGGYSTIGGFDDAINGVGRGVDIDGANLRFGAGLDWFAADNFSIGARLTAEMLFLSRTAVPLRELAEQRRIGTVSDARARVLEADGTAMGSAYAVTVGPGLHF